MNTVCVSKMLLSLIFQQLWCYYEISISVDNGTGSRPKSLRILMNSSCFKESIFKPITHSVKPLKFTSFECFFSPQMNPSVTSVQHSNSQSDLITSFQSSKQTWAQRFVGHSPWCWGGRVWAAVARLLWEWDSAALRTLTAPNLHSSTNTQTKMPLCGLSPAPSISANRHCLCFPPAVYLQNDYCMAHTIC